MVKTYYDNKSIQIHGARKSSSASLLSADEMKEFEALYPAIVDELMKQNDELMPDMKTMAGWMVKVLTYNVGGGEMLSGLMVPVTYKSLVREASPEDMKRAYLLGWVVELFQCASLVTTDIMDNKETRRGKTCWYKLKDVETMAVNDSFLLKGIAGKLLITHFGDSPCYSELIICIRDIMFKSNVGQRLDCMTSRSRDIHKSFTRDRYNSIVKYKTSYYKIYFPVALAMIIAGKSGNKEAMQKVEEVLLEIGHYFQVQADYLDCFGDENVTGKMGTDIQDNKCSWLVVEALERCNAEELKCLLENYGSDDPKKIEKVKKLYRDLDLAQVYADFEIEAQKRISEKIKELPDDVDEEVFRQLMFCKL